jgi:hypothetical protein
LDIVSLLANRRALCSAHRTAALPQLGKHELHLGANLPVRPVVRRDHVVIGGELRIHWQFAEVEDLADAAAERYRPPLAALGFPVGGDDRRAGNVESTVEVVIDEGLDQPVVVGAAGAAVRKRPDVVDQGAIDPRIALLQAQHDNRRAEAPVLVADFGIAVGRQLHYGTGAPDPVPGLGR